MSWGRMAERRSARTGTKVGTGRRKRGRGRKEEVEGLHMRARRLGRISARMG